MAKRIQLKNENGEKLYPELPNSYYTGLQSTIQRTSQGIIDTRSINGIPSYYWGLGAGTYREFKISTATLGIPNASEYFSDLTTFVQWADISGGSVIQEAKCNGQIWTRYSTSTSAWGMWREICPNDVGKSIHLGKNTPQNIPATTTTTVAFETIVSNTTTGLTKNGNRIDIGKGVKSILITAQYQLSALVNNIKYIYIRKNGVTVRFSSMNNTDVVFVNDTIEVAEGDYITLECYVTTAQQINANAWSFLKATVLS